jgi:hypothetical protein
MLFYFLNVLLQVLVRRSHDLLQEEIAIALYNMASADFDKFYLRFLPEFLTGCEGLYAEQKAELSKSFKMDKVGMVLYMVWYGVLWYAVVQRLVYKYFFYVSGLTVIHSWSPSFRKRCSILQIV